MAPHSDFTMTQHLEPQVWHTESSSSSLMTVEDIPKCCRHTKSISARVRFCEHPEVATVPSRCDLSLDEILSTWFNEDDYADLQFENELTECAMTCELNRHLVDDEILCARGLSDSESLLARAECNDFIQKLVLNQIAFLSAQGVKEFDTVAKIYHDCSAPAVHQAHEIALRDAADASQYLSCNLPSKVLEC